MRVGATRHCSPNHSRAASSTMDSFRLMAFGGLLRELLRSRNPWKIELSEHPPDETMELLNSSLRCLLEPVATLRPVSFGGEETG